VSCQSNKLRELLAMRGEVFTPNDCPRIGDFDELLEALRLHHGPEGRPDLIPRTTMTPNPVMRNGTAGPGGATVSRASSSRRISPCRR
jgi:hypothetical protein